MPSVSRGRLILYAAAMLLILERLIIAGFALAHFDKPEINWTSVLLPLTHIAVVLFLIFTSDALIYWLVILWGLITSGTYFYKIFYEMYPKLTAAEKAIFFTKVLPAWWQITTIALFHGIITIVLLLPVVRAYLAKQRSKLDFVDMSPPESPTTPPSPE